MNQLFSFSRWLLFVRKHWSENRKKYLLGLLALAGVIVVWFLFNVLMSPYDSMDRTTQYGTYFVGLFLVGCLYASTLFSDLASKSKGINYLAVPASHLEKVLTALLFGVLFFFVCYTVIFYLADILMVKVSNAVRLSYFQKNSSSIENFRPGEVVNIFRSEERAGRVDFNIAFIFLLTYFAVQSAFLLGSVYFEKFSFIKTTLSLIAVWMIIFLFAGKVLGSWIPWGWFDDGFAHYTIGGNNGEPNKIIELPGLVNTVTLFLLKYSLAPILWVVAYFRLKEKEI